MTLSQFGLLVAQIFVSVLGAWLTWCVRAGTRHMAWMYPVSLVACTLWYLAARKAERLGFIAVAWDVSVAIAYLWTFWYMGENWTWMHTLGALLACAGIALMAT